MKIEFTSFTGEVPLLEPEKLPPNAAQSALNCDLSTGVISPLKNDLFKWTPTKAGTIKSIYLFSDIYWFHWTTEVNVIKGPIADDVSERTFWTGDGEPKVTDNTIATSGGGTNYPLNWYKLGVPKPASAPSVALVDTTGSITGATQANPVSITSTAHGRSAGETVYISGVVGMTEINSREFVITVVDANTFTLNDEDGTAHTAYASGGTWKVIYEETEKESTAYVYTYVTGWGEEGPPSTASASIDRGVDQQVDLTGLLTGPGAGYNVTNKRIYRYAEGVNSGDYQLVSEIAIGNTSYSDNAKSSELGGLLETDGFIPPEVDSFGLMLLGNGVSVLFRNKEICPSEPFHPYAYPRKYRLTTDYPIVGGIPLGESFAVLTEGKPYFVTGAHPDSYSIYPIEIPQACVSSRSIASLGNGGIYASPDGLVMIDVTGTANVITGQVFNREKWQALKPESIIGIVHEDRYYGFYDTGSVQGGFIFDPKSPLSLLTFTNTTATALYTHLVSDSMYLCTSGAIREWNADTTFKTATWKSKKFYTDFEINFSLAKVYAESYPVTFKLYADGVLKHTETVASDDPFWLPGDYLAKAWEIELSGTSKIINAVIANEVTEL